MPLVVISVSTRLMVGLKRQHAESPGVCSPVCFGRVSACRANTAPTYLFARFTQMDCGIAACAGAQYLIRMNFSNNPLLAGVDQRGRRGLGRGGRYEAGSFITFQLHQCFFLPL